MTEILDERDALGVDEIVRRLPKGGGFTISILSRRQSGKSHLTRQLIQLLVKEKRVDVVLVFSGTAHLTDDYDILPKSSIMPYSEEMMERISQKQKADVLAWKHPEPGEERPPKPKRVLLVLDDCLATPEAVRSPALQAVYVLGRHVFLSCIVLSQVANILCTPLMKTNTDILLWSRLPRFALENLWESLTNIDKKDFIHLSESLGGQNFSFMLLDNTSQTARDPSEFLSVIRADP